MISNLGYQHILVAISRVLFHIGIARNVVGRDRIDVEVGVDARAAGYSPLEVPAVFAAGEEPETDKV